MRQLTYKTVRHKLIMFTATMLWLLLIIILSVMPYTQSEGLPDTETVFRWDYLEHFAGYFLLALLAALWRADRNLSLPLSGIIIIIAGGSVISFILEYIQLYIPGRAFNMIDVASNITGLLAGLLTAYFIILPALQRRYLPPE